MKNIATVIFRFSQSIVLAFLVLLMVSCTIKSEEVKKNGAAVTAVPPAPPAPPVVPPSGPPGIVDDNAGFYVRQAKSEKVTYNIHKGTNTFSEECKANTGESIECVMEGNELDIYFHGATLQYNVPSLLCSYLEFRPYHYYRWQAGESPTVINVDTDRNGKVGRDTNNDGLVDGKETCPYDHTEVQGPNCCSGKYQKLSRTWNSTTNTYNAATVSDEKWTGSVANCLAGPGFETLPKSKEGLPKSLVTYVEGLGMNQTYAVAAPIGREYSSNIHVANYFNILEHMGDFPTALRTVTYRDANDVRRAYFPSPYYRFRCLDRNYDTQAEIRVLIREWNTAAAYNSRVTAPNQHDMEGAEPNPFGDYDLNDHRDWRDMEEDSPFPRNLFE